MMWHAFAGHQAVYKQVYTRELNCQGSAQGMEGQHHSLQ